MTTETVKHTPGPWRRHPVTEHWVVSDYEETETMAHYNIIADVPNPANTRLIAQAPALLAVAEQMLAQYRAFVDQCCKGQDNRYHEQRIEAAQAAIRKATS